MPHIEHALGWPSVTQVLDVLAKPFLIFWYGKYGTAHCDKVKKEGADVGTMFHTDVENRILSKPEQFTPINVQIKRMVDSLFNLWVLPQGIRVLHTEVSLEDKELRFHGTFDAVILMNGRLYIVDWKTSNQMDEVNHPLQLAAYAYLWNVVHPEAPIDAGIIVRVDKKKAFDPTKDIETYDQLSHYFDEFKNARSLFDYVKGVGKWDKAA